MRTFYIYTNLHTPALPSSPYPFVKMSWDGIHKSQLGESLSILAPGYSKWRIFLRSWISMQVPFVSGFLSQKLRGRRDGVNLHFYLSSKKLDWILHLCEFRLWTLVYSPLNHLTYSWNPLMVLIMYIGRETLLIYRLYNSICWFKSVYYSTILCSKQVHKTLTWWFFSSWWW